MCGDAGNPPIHVFVRERQAPSSHYNTALLQEIARKHVDGDLIASHGQHFFHVKKNRVAYALPGPRHIPTPPHLNSA